MTIVTPRTINEFNGMTDNQKRLFVNYETEGDHFPNASGMLVYDDHRSFVINYERDNKGRLIRFEAETLKQGIQRIIMHLLAKRAMEEMN